MKRRVAIKPTGGLFIGVGGSVRAGVDDETVRDPEGVPYIPASTLKGAIREQMQRLVPEDTTARILGPRVKDDSGLGGGAVLVGPGIIEHHGLREFFKAGLGYQLAHHVSIGRKLRRAADQRLFTHEIVSPFIDGLEFVAGIQDRALDESDSRILDAAIRAVFALGGSRTSGLGGVELEITESAVASGEPRMTIPDGEDLIVEIESLQPLLLGASLSPGNDFESESYIPASTLRGAIITAALGARGIGSKEDQSGIPEFHAAVLDPTSCARYGDALPGSLDSQNRRVPFTLRTCKYNGIEHGWMDALLLGYLQLELAASGVPFILRERCEVCGGRLEAAGPLLRPPSLSRRVVTGIAMDGPTGKTMEGQLYTAQLVEPTRFVAPIHRADAFAKALVADAAGAEIQLGRGSSRGYGRARISRAQRAVSYPLVDRIASFQDACRGLLEGGDNAPTLPGLAPPSHTYLTVTALSDVVLHTATEVTREGNAEDEFLSSLGTPGGELVMAQVRASRRGGFDSLRGVLKNFDGVIRSGSCVLFRFQGQLPDSVIARMQTLERDGVGLRREEGFGWISVCDQIHIPGWRRS